MRFLMKHAAPNLLGILGRAHDENAHSEVIRWLLDPRCAPNVAPITLASLVAHLEPATEWTARVRAAVERDSLSVRREYVYGREWEDSEELDRIDLVISGGGFVIPIENKLWAVEHGSQTLAYWSWLERLPGLRAGIFLTPTGFTAACPHFVPVSYLDLLRCFLDAALTGKLSGAEQSVLASYVKTLADHVLRPEARTIRGMGGAP